MTAERRLLIFAKAPVAGRVKTRLSRQLGAGGAARAYRELLTHTLHTARQCEGAALEIWCSPGKHPILRRLARTHAATLRVQPPGDLGRRMARALAHALRSAPSAVLIGGDCATLTRHDLAHAFERLETGAEWVFAPAEDGGYTLVGARRASPLPFRAIPWGSDAVMRATRQRLRRMDAPWAELPTTWDVDRPCDWHRWRRNGRCA